MKKLLHVLVLLLALGRMLIAQGTLQTGSEVIQILEVNEVNRSILFIADLSAVDFEEDLSGVSQIIFARTPNSLMLNDFGANRDAVKGDRKFTATFNFGKPLDLTNPLGSANPVETGTEATVESAIAELTRGPFVFSLISDFANNPPLPKSLQVQRITPPDSKGRNVKIIADMTSAAAELGDKKIFNIQVGEFSARFRDDGKFNDAKENDMSFTASVKATEAELQSFLKTNETAAKLNKGVETKFVGRSIVSTPAATFDAAAFNAGKITELKPLTPFVVNNSNLPSIRDKCLMVRDISVVEDPTRTYDPLPPAQGNENGAWSFGTLIAGIAGKSNPEDALQFTINWVDTKLFGEARSTVSGDFCGERSISKETFVRAWLTNSGTKPPTKGVPADWRSKVKVRRFPVRLLAIMNRLDLRGNLAFGLSNVGEGRFVYCFVDSNKNGSFGASINGFGSMTIILEYGLPLKTCDAVESYVKGWFALKDQAWGATYNQQLQSLTDQFTALNAAPERQNGSALNHLRTSEFLQSKVTAPMNGRDWEIRDFELSANALEHTWQISKGKEPGGIWNGPRPGTPLLKSLVNFVNETDFNKDFDVPDHLRAISAPMPLINPQGRNNGLIWVGSSAQDEVMNPLKRREFSLQTCTGCHSAETRIAPFLHVKPRARRTPTICSSFMVGPSPVLNPTQLSIVADPVAGGALPPKQFNDALRRAVDLADLFFNFKCKPAEPLTPIRTFQYPVLNNDH